MARVENDRRGEGGKRTRRWREGAAEERGRRRRRREMAEAEEEEVLVVEKERDKTMEGRIRVLGKTREMRWVAIVLRVSE